MNRVKSFRLLVLTIWLGIFFGLFSFSCATNPVSGKRELMLLGEAQEIRLGKKTDAQIVKTYGVYDDPKLTAYIQDLGQRMGRLSHRPNLRFEFKILDSPVVNAFAVPGGYVYLTRGVLSYLNSEAELACVIGHEIGHVAARHSAKQYTRAQLTRLGFELGGLLSETFRRYAGLIKPGVGLLFLRFSRDNERQADALGVEYATRAGFDASQMANFFMTLQRLKPGADSRGLQGWFFTHPNPPERIRAVLRNAGLWQRKLHRRKFQVNHEAYLRKIDGLVFGEDPRQGYVDHGVFYHPGLKFEFPVPADWKITNTPTEVRMVSKERDAAILFVLAPGVSPADAAVKFIARAGARLVKSETVRVHGLPARRLISEITGRSGAIRVISYFIKKEKQVFVFHGFTSAGCFQRYRPLFRATMDGFKEITDPKRINVKPDRIHICRTRNTGSLKEALRSFGVPNDKLEETALLNGKRLTDLVPAGTLVKVVGK